MGEVFRSEEMQMVQLFVQFEAAHDTVDELGKVGKIQFVDLNKDQTAFQRNFVNEVKRCDEMERKLRFLNTQINTDPEASAAVMSTDVPANITMDALETKLLEEEAELLEANTNQEALYRNRNELLELKQVIEKDATFFAERDDGMGVGAEDSSLLDEEMGKTELSSASTLGFVTGVLVKEKFASFERVLWRALRGNLFMKHKDIEIPIEDPHTGEKQEKLVFIIFFQGERAQNKIRKICDAFKANLYPCPETSSERRELAAQVDGRLADLTLVLERGLEHRQKVLTRVARDIFAWTLKVKREKAIYHTMNLFNYDVGRKCLIAEGWCPSNAINDIHQALRRATDKSGALVPSILSEVKTPTEEPPTYFKLNKFTATFQEIVNAYGVPKYGEANPMPFSIVTFPFLFAVMYGDIGHGTLITIIAALLIIKEKSLMKADLGELFGMAFAGRYLLLLMGIFSMYTGLIYNDCFSIPMELFGSKYEINTETLEFTQHGVYPFGIDPVWMAKSSNGLQFYNSIKMKMSIIYGVSQMLMGIFLHFLNGVYFRKPYNIFFEFIPQFLFLSCLFGYMCFLIFFKWAIDWTGKSSEAPQILITMINMFLKPTELEWPPMFPGQLQVQQGLAILAVICVPFMLFPKPFLLRRDHNRGYIAVGHDAHGGHFDFTEIFVHQIIHTIEFVLGAISNTASYLRLWALSLAHAELSEVFYQKAFILTMQSHQFYMVFVGFAVWAGFTVGVLLVMEALSAFLHALRLHWVEFQNKFFDGSGKIFTPFSYDTLGQEQ